MVRLRPRERTVFSGFAKAEVKRMEILLKELGGQSIEDGFCKRIARSFNSSNSRAGKPIVKWTEVQNWLHRQKIFLQKDTSPNALKQNFDIPEACPSNKANEGGKVPGLSELEFEARSPKDGAWYDVDVFINHRFLSSGDAEVLVRYIGFEDDEDEWVNAKAVRLRSVPFDHSECEKVKVGDVVLCFQERRDQARYYDARILEIERKVHDIRGCRCLFLIQYAHDETEERVRLRRLCYRPA